MIYQSRGMYINLIYQSRGMYINRNLMLFREHALDAHTGAEPTGLDWCEIHARHCIYTPALD